MKKMKWLPLIGLIAMAAAFVVACGENGEPGPTPTPTPPPGELTTLFEFAADTRIQALNVGADALEIFGFFDGEEDETPPADFVPDTPVSLAGAPLLTVVAVEGPGTQSISVRVQTGTIVSTPPHFDGETFLGLNPSWGPGLELTTELLDFQHGDVITVRGYVTSIGTPGGWPTESEWGDPADAASGWDGDWFPAGATPRLILQSGIDTDAAHAVMATHTGTGPFELRGVLNLTQAGRGSIRIGLAGINMDVRVDNIIFQTLAEPLPPPSTPEPGVLGDFLTVTGINVTGLDAPIVAGARLGFGQGILGTAFDWVSASNAPEWIENEDDTFSLRVNATDGNFGVRVDIDFEEGDSITVTGRTGPGAAGQIMVNTFQFSPVVDAVEWEQDANSEFNITGTFSAAEDWGDDNAPVNQWEAEVVRIMMNDVDADSAFFYIDSISITRD